MSPRLSSSALHVCAVRRTAAVAASRYSKTAPIEHVDRSTTSFATLDGSKLEATAKMSPSTLPSAGLSLPEGMSAKAFAGDKRLDRQRKTVVLDEEQGKIAHAWEPAEKELWLERFGGPGKRIEKVAGRGTVLLREVAPDGKGYLRVLI